MCTETFLRLPEEKRNRFLDAAWEEFTSVPFSDVSINKIIQRAGIPRGSFYQYFLDKSDLFSYLLTEIRLQAVQNFSDMLDAAGGDPFAVQMMAYDHFVSRRNAPPPVLEHCIRLARLNVGMDMERAMSTQPEGETVLEALSPKLNTSVLRQQDQESAKRTFAMATMLMGSAIMDTLRCPERSEENRRELEARLEIIKYGSLRRDCAEKPA